MNTRNILLTGASRGLGLEIARYLLKKGYTLHTMQRTHSDELSALAKQYPKRIHSFQVDLASGTQVEETFQKEHFSNGKTVFHGYVNNAATAYDDLITNLQSEPLDQMFQVNVFTPLFLTRWILRNMLLHSTRGSIVHISSICAHTAYKGLAMYASTKGAIEAFSRTTAREWGARKIRSNCVVCGFMETDMSAKLDEESRDRIYRRTSLKEATSPHSVASLVAHLLSEESNSITGQNLFVDSGTI